MAINDAESCESRALPEKPLQYQRQNSKFEVYDEVLCRLKESGFPEVLAPSFKEELWSHFNRLPARYALDVNVERAEEVLTHKRLLRQAQDPSIQLAFDIRLVQMPRVESFGTISSQSEEDTYIHPPPTFGSSTNLENLALEVNNEHVQDGDISNFSRPMHEVTFSTEDKPKLLSQLTTLLSEAGLNIQEAHAFSTNDGYSLDVFVVDGWPDEETSKLREALQKEIHKVEKQACLPPRQWPSKSETLHSKEGFPDHIKIPTDGTDVWEIDTRLLKFKNKLASGSQCDLYRGTYCSQDVAIKVFKPEHVSVDMQREFAQEVYIMRKIRHKNVVQFIGACTQPPSLFIVTEFMAGGSLYDFLHKQKGVFKLPTLLRVAVDVCKGMSYLHQNDIIHRDLKTANILMDENEVVKVADFGVARVKAQSGVMTAETGTYRWMAPEVIEHNPYDHKADVFSFAIMIWELLTGKLPYEYLTPLQAAVGVVQKSLSLLFDLGEVDDPDFARVWATASDKLTSLEIGYIPVSMLTALLALAAEARQSSSVLRPSLFPNLQKLCLSVDYITDVLMSSLSTGLPFLTQLDLQDAPIVEPIQHSDLTNLGLQHINHHGKLKHISLIRSQEFLFTYFRRVNDLGILLMSDTCASLESINLGGFCRVTDTGFRAIIHACANLRKLRVSHGSQLTDLVFHDISATSLSLTHVSLRWCNLLTNIGIERLSFNADLAVIDLRDCRNIGDESLVCLSHLHKLHTLLLDGTDVSDAGLSFLGRGRFPLTSLSLRGCKRLTDACILSLFCGSVGLGIQMLDLSRIPNLSDNGILSLAKTRIPLAELRIRECPLIGDTSVMALASMQIEGGSFGSSMHLLDIYDCGGITPIAIRWFKKPYFPRLRWLGVNGCLNRDMVDSLVRNRPFLHVACRGEELGNGFWDSSFGWHHHEDDELDELEQWLLEGEDGDDDEGDIMLEWP